MQLTVENLKEWKKALDKECRRQNWMPFSNCLSDDNWINEYLGEDHIDIVHEEIISY